MAIKQTSFRIPPDTLAQLDELCQVSDMNRTQWICAAIDTSYDRLQGNPKLKEVLQQMETLKGQMEQLGVVTNRPKL